MDKRARISCDNFFSAVDTKFGYDIAVTLSEDQRFHNSPWGDRTAGSKAEHAAADWLAERMWDIGLTDVEKVGVRCDLWQFNGASLRILGDEKIITPHSYATPGTSGEGITAQVIYVGRGTASDYENIDARGKIVLIDINQRTNWWITYPMLEAQFRGAAAIMSAQTGGFSQISPDAYNAQDICAKACIPCVSISLNDSKYIREKLEDGPVMATLTVDNRLEINKGVTYNVTGRIKGKSSDYQILVGAHYDAHFHGFQDDSCAVGLVLTIAKAMIDSDYVPENDIVFCLHGAEEWGASGTMFDWTVGAWEMIHTARPEWQKRTLAFINLELPAYEFDRYTTTYSPPEMFKMLDYYAHECPFSPKPENCFPEGVLTEGYPTYTYSDDFSYSIAGVPSMVNGFLLQRDMETVFPFYIDIYHSNFDTKDTYNEAVMEFNTKYYGALAIYIDQTPALYLDFTAQFDRLSAAIDEEIMCAAGADIGAYRIALEGMKAAAQQLAAKVIDVNGRYNRAKLENGSERGLSAIWAEGRELTKKNLEAFKFVQDAFLGLMYEKPIVPHEAPQRNIALMEKTVAALKEGDGATAVDEYAWQINHALEWYPMHFSPEVIAAEMDMLLGEATRNKLYWGTNKMFAIAEVEEATRGLVQKYGVEGADFTSEIAVYERAIRQQREILIRLVKRETADIKTLTQMLR